jgi:hypothetical protein
MERDLETRLRVVEHRLALIELEGSYARLFDSRRGDQWAELFTTDGVYEGREMPGVVDAARIHVKGRPALAKFCDAAPFSGIHLLNVPQIALEEHQATARVHFSFHAEFDTGRSQPEITSMIGYYDVAYALIDDHWLIRRRVTTPFGRHRLAGHGYEPRGAFEP